MPSEILIDFFAGFLGGTAGVLAGYPLDTVKVRLQTQSIQAPEYRGTLDCTRQIFIKEGLRGLYKGISSPLASLAAVNAMIFGVHGYVVKQFDNRCSPSTHFIAGFCAGSAQALIVSPMELLKLRVQLCGNPEPITTPFSYFKNIIIRKEQKTLIRGMLATQMRDAPGLGVYFASYEYLARKLSKDGSLEALTSLQLLTAGGVAGMTSWLFNYPIDVIKTRFQADDNSKNYTIALKKLYQEGGVRAFFVGFTPTLLRAFPANAATFFTAEWTIRILIDHNILNSTVKNAAAPSPTPLDGQMNESNNRTSERPDRKTVYELTTAKLWKAKSFLLPEAGSTFLEPFLGTI